MSQALNRESKMYRLLFIALIAILPPSVTHAETSKERGKYLAVIAGCNDCHTAGFGAKGGDVPENEWFTGDSMGWHGPWGTTYAINLRKLVALLTPDAWLALVKNSKARPPMPSYILKTMSDKDLLALYDFIQSLGTSDKVIPAALPPGQIPQTEYINFVPVSPKK